ncbi:MAG: family 78 glycoside hydrolase catalytic domain [Fimbriimonas sp.]
MKRSILLGAAMAMPLVAGARLEPARLRCEFLIDPVGIEEAKPRLSWTVDSDLRGDVQTAYRILVASTPDLLRQGRGDLWDTRRIESDQTSHIEYGGTPLKSGQRAWWTVTVWDRNGNARISKPALWEMGLLQPSDWKAQWIGMPAPSAPSISPSWIWTSDGNAAGAPKGSRFFRTNIEVGPGEVKEASLGIAADNSFEATLNGKPLFKGEDWRQYTKIDLKPHLKSGLNELVVRATNEDGPAGLAVLGQITHLDGRTQAIATSADWQASVDGKDWTGANAWAKMGDRPYGKINWNTAGAPSPHLRRSFDVSRRVRRARAYVSARGIYKLFVDGKPVGNGIFTPGWTDYNKRIQYQTYDLTPVLRTGRHTVGMLLGDGWYCGKIGLTGKGNYGDRPQGLAQIEIEYEDGSREQVVSDKSWQVATGAILNNDLLDGETYDARKELKDWATPVPKGGSWLPASAEPIGTVPLVGQHSQMVERIVEIKPKAITEPKPGVFVFDLGQNMVGWTRLRVRGEAGKTVTIRFAEMLNPNGTIYTTNLRGAKCTDNYTLKGGGPESYEPTFTFHGFRYVEVTGYPGTPTADAITGVVVSSDTPQSGTLSTSSPLVNQLQSNIVWGQRGNYLEVPTDCPQRDERLGWMADAQVFIRTATYNNDISAFITKWMQDVVDAQSPEGGFPDVAPRMGAMGDGAPAWGDAGVIVPWTMYRVYGDRRILERHYDAMAKWIDYIHSANPDLIWRKRSNANYGDWLNMNADLSRDLIGTAYFAHSTDLMGRIARVLGKTEDAARFEKLRADIGKAFVATYVSPDGMVKDDTQTAYLLALRFNLAPEEMRANIAKRLVDDIMVKRKGHLSTGFVGVSFLNPTLTEIGRSDVAYRLLLNDTFPSWGYSIRQGATTIWERWDGWTKEKGFQDPGMNSFNHYSLGSVGEWMFGSMAGIDLDPAVPAYKKIVVRPQIGSDLTWVKGGYDSLHGRIETAWRRTAGGDVELDVNVPANTMATVYVPAASAEAVQEGKTAASAAEGVKFLRMEDGNAVFSVGGGKYRFRAKKG